MSPIDIAIVNYNTREELRACLDSIRGEQPAQVIVADNASTDGSASMVRATFPAVLLLENNTNPGFCAAANQAIHAGKSDYVLLLNSDTRLRPGVLDGLAAYLDQHSHVAIAGPRLDNPDGTLQSSTFPFPIPLDIFLDASHLSGLARLFPTIRERYLRTWSHARVRSVPWVSGAALAIRREAFDQVGGFDESYFMYYEEVDLCFRLIEHGWQIHFVPDYRIVHRGGASTQQRWAEMTIQLYRSLALFYRQHYSASRLVMLMLLVRAIAFFRLLRDGIALLATSQPAQKAVLASHITAWKCLLAGGWERQASHG